MTIIMIIITLTIIIGIIITMMITAVRGSICMIKPVAELYSQYRESHGRVSF